MLEIQGVYKRFNLRAGFFASEGSYIYALNGIGFTIVKKEIYGLVGESGCGKTTMARLIVGMHRADAGTITFHDRSGRQHNPQTTNRREKRLARSKIKYIFQDPARSLNPRMSIREILTAGYRYSPIWTNQKEADERAANILADVGMQPHDMERRPADFSGGQRQRIALARALIYKPELLICDEVVSALDVSIQTQILDLLLALRERYDLSILFIAHDLAVVGYLCDRIGVMYRGLLMEEADAAEITRHHRHPYTNHLYASVPQLDTAARNARSFTQFAPESTSGQPSFTTQFQSFDPTARPSIWDQLPEQRRDRGMDEVAPNHFVSRHWV